MSSTPLPEVGQKIAYCIGSDRYAVTIKDVQRGGQTVIVELRQGRNVHEYECTKGRDGVYREKGHRIGMLDFTRSDGHLSREF
jgi:hypothetical protein